MKRRYSIGFFIGILILISMFVFVFKFSYTKVRDDYNVKAEASINHKGYWIKEKDGYMIVYYGDGEKVYEYTSILIEELPEEIQEQIHQGIYVEAQSEVYGFLENYSSENMVDEKTVIV